MAGRGRAEGNGKKTGFWQRIWCALQKLDIDGIEILIHLGSDSRAGSIGIQIQRRESIFEDQSGRPCRLSAVRAEELCGVLIRVPNIGSNWQEEHKIP